LALKLKIRNDPMKRNTIKWRIFKYNIIVIIILIVLTTAVFNIAVRLYFESDVTKQLDTIALKAEDTALHKGQDFFPKPIPPDGKMQPPPPDNLILNPKYGADSYFFYFMLDRSLREPLSVLNADYILFDDSKKAISPPEGNYFKPSEDITNKVSSELSKLSDTNTQKYMNFKLSGTEYIAIAKPVSSKNTFGLGWIVIYSSLKKVNQLQWVINLILFAILIISSMIMAIFSSMAAKKISAPFSSLNRHISEISERNFGTKILIPVEDEFKELVNNINTMSEKLESYDKAQKTFLQNASHEFRTPLMSIQSYAEGIKYDVVESNAAADIIIDETKRMTHLVEDLLYLSRLDAIEESYHLNNLNFDNLMNTCIERVSGIANKNGISITLNASDKNIEIYADEEKLSRAFTNILSNCIRYADTSVKIYYSQISDKRVEITIIDDGPGFDAAELSNIFERFYKGKKGIFGLGLAISRNIIEKHNGEISAENSGKGALFKIILPVKE
jgi:signal transduction histidine kinase